MGDPQLRSRYDRLRDEREARQRDNPTPPTPEYESWNGEDVDIVYETDTPTVVNPDTGEIEEPTPDVPLYRLSEQWNNGKLIKTDIVYGDDIKQLAYEIWFLRANRNNARTAEMLQEELEGLVPRYPKPSTIRNWRREYEWDERVSNDLAQIAPMLNRQHLERLFAYTAEAIETKIQIMRNEHPERDAKRLDTISRSVDSFLQLRGLGTAGVQGGNEPPKAATKAVEAASSVQEASSALRDEILEGKQVIAGKKKHKL